MQRRAVAVYVAFFLIIAAASYTLIATAEEPTMTLDNAEYELSETDTFTVGDQEYTVTSIEETTEEVDDGHGGSEEVSTTIGTIEWTETNVEMSETWANEDTVEIDDTEWQVLIEDDAENTSSFTFQEELDRQAILESDPNVLNETEDVDGEEYVVDQSGGENDLTPAEEYFPAPATETASVGDSFTYNDQTVTVEEVTAEGVTVSWTEDQTNMEELEHEQMVELADDTEYLVFMPGDGTMMITSDTTEYDAQIQTQQQFSERLTGFRWTTFTSLLFALSLIAFAFLPSRY